MTAKECYDERVESLLRRSIVVLAALCGGVVACNALLGVEDVALGEERDGTARDDAGDSRSDSDPNSPLDPPPPGEDGEAPEADRTALSLGFYHTCARMLDGTVRCWGRNSSGQLGDGVPLPDGGTSPFAHASKPQSVPGINDAIAVGTGLAHTCIARKPGTVFCWGSNNEGQLGNGTQQSSSSPVAVLNVQGAVAIAGASLYTCALLKDKTLACWGDNFAGQLGDGSKARRLTAAPVNQLKDVASVSTGWGHVCAVLTNGDVMCWGLNNAGQLGIGSLAVTLTPTKVTALSEIVQVAAANRSTCARQKSGRVYCWGSNDNGQLGNETLSAATYPYPTLVPSVDDAKFLWAGHEHICALRRSGAVVCWGRASSGQLGGGVENADGGVATPSAVMGVTTAVAVWTGGSRGCALAHDGRALCWGDNDYGQIGNGTREPAYTAVPVSDFP